MKSIELYKLTDADGFTRRGLLWSKGVKHDVYRRRGAPKLCSNTVLHAYRSPLLAALMNPAHANYQSPLCFTVLGFPVVDDGTKVGCRSLRVTGVFEFPRVSTTARVAFGILSTLRVYSEPNFVAWADGWLSGRDRTFGSADAVRAARAARAATATTATAAYAASAAAAAAANSAYTADAAATYAAGAAAEAADAAHAGKLIDFQALAEKALEIV
jgi:hypothetical protein